MNNILKITMILLIVVNIAALLIDITEGWQSYMLKNVVIISLSLQILMLIRDNNKLEKEKVAILRSNNRSDDE
ncbi:hypothetical protein MUA77_10895 [Mammaliicoccus sciuri]|uniref:hypothetical protein n=1 Tax=Mammaliicoccus sciuri TaxID=1296 RepID=UPI0021D0E1EC|nr:hypothetical protein [Mammaliicoccus sciuri]UXU83308.1 hypothetical protein MUA77_10895 [Mammaliicoccus sciuri]UXU93155.1 hypothetical protein MUA42_10905 [Mammaliicoccus sciuri]UXV15105.1 hypothetical protein MUA89_11170 [Mammaliicoccus sciuri]UXV23368.1 hypothetical protein MUA49_10900 [Mammaliicoccus sciuri]UXV26146.1 hypothetical protein MUA96_11155 [Mammaliicoccus sciuri]